MTVTTGQTATVPAGTCTVTIAGSSAAITTITATAGGTDTFVLGNTSPAAVVINGFVAGTDKLTGANGLHDYAQTTSGIDMWFNDGTHVVLAGVQGAAAAQVMSSTTNPPITVYSGQTVTTQPGFTDTVTMVGSTTLTTNGNDTVNAGTGSDTIKVNAGNVLVNGSATGTLSFIEAGSGTATLNLKGGTTTAKLGAGTGIVNIAGTTAITCGTGADIFNLVKGMPIGSDNVIWNFAVGTDHLHLSGYGSGTSAVAWITNGKAGVSLALTDGTHVGLVGVHTTTLSQLFT
jgi:hypothetical protein